MAVHEDENFERRIEFRHTVGTVESITITNHHDPSGKDDCWGLAVTAPNGLQVSATLNSCALDALIEALLDLRDASERIEHRRGRRTA